MGCHCNLIQVHSKIYKETVIEVETELLFIPVVHKLSLGIIYRLPCKLILQLQCYNRNTVQRQYNVNGVMILDRICKLSCTGKDIAVIFLYKFFVKVRCRSKVGKSKFHTPVLYTISENMNQAVLCYVLLKNGVELLFCLLAIYIDVPLPHLRLSGLDERYKHRHINSLALIVCILITLYISV